MPTVETVMRDPKFHRLPLAAQSEVLRRVGASEDQVSRWVGMVTARSGEPTLSAQTGPERPLTPEQQAELDAADAERTTRLRGAGYSEGIADARDWRTMAEGVAFAAAPSVAAAALPVAEPALGAARSVLRSGGALLRTPAAITTAVDVTPKVVKGDLSGAAREVAEDALLDAVVPGVSKIPGVKRPLLQLLAKFFITH